MRCSTCQRSGTVSELPRLGARVIRALVTTGLHAFPVPTLDAGYLDTSQRSESLALDVCIADPGSWGPPRFIAEHVSAPRRASIQHSAWKLLATRTERRVLVTYSGAKSDVRDHVAIESVVREVCVANPGKSAPKDIVVVSADINARPCQPRNYARSSSTPSWERWRSECAYNDRDPLSLRRVVADHRDLAVSQRAPRPSRSCTDLDHRSR
jgi:hypothetical protein